MEDNDDSAIKQIMEKIGWNVSGEEKEHTLDGLKRKAYIDLEALKSLKKASASQIKEIEKAMEKAQTYGDWQNILGQINNFLHL